MKEIKQLGLLFALTLCSISCATAPHSTKHSGSLSKENRARLLVEAANGALIEGDPVGALQNLQEAENLSTDLPELYHTRALAFAVRKEFAKAVIAAKKALLLKPDYMEANNTLGKLLLDQGLYSEAEAPLKLAAEDSTYRGSYKANTNLGLLYYEKEDLKNAEKFFTKAAEIEPRQSCFSQLYLAKIKNKQGNDAAAIEILEFLSKRECIQFAEIHLQLGIAYEKNKQYDLARKKYQSIKELFPTHKVANDASERLRYVR